MGRKGLIASIIIAGFCKKTPIKEPNKSSKSEYDYHKADCFQKAINPVSFIVSHAITPIVNERNVKYLCFETSVLKMESDTGSTSIVFI